MYSELNINPLRKNTGDCVVRAIGTVTDRDWDDVYLDLVVKGFQMKEMPSLNSVWGSYLKDLGFKRYIIPDTCDIECYTVEDFSRDHPTGRYILGTGTHVIAVIDGVYYDTWPSGEEIPIYYFAKEN